jgi:hypothetical protein
MSIQVYRDETLPELAQSIKKLTRLAYPIAHSTLISVLSLEHFIDAIPDGDIRLRLREVNPKNINEAETLAVRLETLKLADRQKGRMIRKVGEQAPDLNPVKINNSEDNIKHLKMPGSGPRARPPLVSLVHCILVIIPIEIIIGTITPISIEFTIISGLSILIMLIVI